MLPRSAARSTQGINLPHSVCFQPATAQKLFTANKCWTSFLDAGVKEYGCDNPGCRHVKYITNACPYCGKKATNPLLAAQLNRLPDCDWIHQVFTLPDSLWPLFEVNR
jgi:hypothetical protein